MHSKTEYLRDLRQQLLRIKSEMLREFYYLEAKELRFRSSESEWNIIEIFEHLNILNHYYIRKINTTLLQTPDSEDDYFKNSWLGNVFITSMLPDGRRVKYKIKTFRKSDPRYLCKRKGRVLIGHIVFQDFIDGLEQLIQLLEKSEQKPIGKLKVPTFLPLLKMNLGDIFGFLTAHIQRHFVQARNLLEEA